MKIELTETAGLYAVREDGSLLGLAELSTKDRRDAAVIEKRASARDQKAARLRRACLDALGRAIGQAVPDGASIVQEGDKVFLVWR